MKSRFRKYLKLPKNTTKVLCADGDCGSNEFELFGYDGNEYDHLFLKCKNCKKILRMDLGD